jgi:hypothetical protein
MVADGKRESRDASAGDGRKSTAEMDLGREKAGSVANQMGRWWWFEWGIGAGDCGWWQLNRNKTQPSFILFTGS